MVNSGRVLDFSSVPGPKIDKHSTGGVGDKISLILVPLIAACDVYVPMISGRALGHTGGTLDKLESIPGFRTDLTVKEMRRALRRVGCFISGPTAEVGLADKKIYALRDVTGTVDSIPLITASIMSKKLAEGIDGLVFDVKCGQGAFIKKRKDAVRLARWMMNVGERMGKMVIAVVTNMDQPIGRTIGNGLEIWETIKTLKDKGKEDVKELVLVLGSEMLILANRVKNEKEGRYILMNMIESGKGFEKFKEIVEFQGGDVEYLEEKENFIKAKYQYIVKARYPGYVSSIDTLGLGMAGLELGVGRRKLDDKIDSDSGFELLKKVGDGVDRKEDLVIVHSNKKLDELFLERVLGFFKMSKIKVVRPELVIKKLLR